MQKPISEDKQLKWKTLIENQRQSGLPVGKWCLQNEINSHTFQYWKARLFPKQLEKNSFTELKLKRPDGISLRTRGLHVRLKSDCDPHLRKQLLALLGELSC